MEVVMISRNAVINKNKFDLSYLREICIQSPILIINTPCGLGKYTFNKIIYNAKNELIFEYKLLIDDSFKDTMNIRYNLGMYFELSADQLLYTFKSYSHS